MIFIYLEYQGSKVYYEYLQCSEDVKTDKRKSLLFLHGWGCNSKTFQGLVEPFKQKYNLYLIDLPGFGKSTEPLFAYTLDDYAELLKYFMKLLELKEVILIAHSFGGRVAIRYLSKNKNANPVLKLILIASAGLKKKVNISKHLKVFKYKFKKTWYKITKNYLEYNYLIKNSGSSDYQNASIMMKKIMKQVIKENLKNDLRKIACPVLLIWGNKDLETPLYQAVMMKKLLKQSELITFDEAGHFVYLDEQEAVQQIIHDYLER